ncbi:MAG: transglutaminase-like cysteine peptidase [Alphaproteobacteria bacterium]|nr:transglutaminase-like cysteine peptidase [Alphaproteobacteria bacterium]
MTPRFTHFRLLGVLALCAMLLGCLRREGLYPNFTSPPPIDLANSETVPAVLPPPDKPPQEVTTDQAQTKPVPAPEIAIVSPPPPRQEEQGQKDPAPTAPKASTTRFIFHSFFIDREKEFDNIQMFPRWIDMLSRYNAESHTLNAICGADPYSPCKLKDWKATLEGLRGKPLPEQLDAVDRFINAYPYVDDIVNWGFDNYWETPYEFQRKSGNCKDYAIAKFMSLRALGVPNSQMRVVVVRDLNLGGIIHAVLIVFIDEKGYILDNQIKQVMPADKIYHYVPIYSINERHWWQHFMLEQTGGTDKSYDANTR